VQIPIETVRYAGPSIARERTARRLHMNGAAVDHSRCGRAEAKKEARGKGERGVGTLGHPQVTVWSKCNAWVSTECGGEELLRESGLQEAKWLGACSRTGAYLRLRFQCC